MIGGIRICTRRSRCIKYRFVSAFAEKLVDPALQLLLFLLALAQALGDIGDRELGVPTKLSRHQMILARKERPFFAIVSDICRVGRLMTLLNSTLAPFSEMSRTTQFLVAPRSPISATPP
jgi:hypothetical protein